jgi:hypothetical protein
VAFDLNGNQGKFREARGRANEFVQKGLENARIREQRRDTGAGPLFYATGSPDKTESQQFYQVGLLSPFSQAVQENPDYFGLFHDRWDAFLSGLNGGGSSSA